MIRLLFIIPLLFFAGLAHAQIHSTYTISPAGGSFNSSSIAGVWSVGGITGGSSELNNTVIRQGFVVPEMTSTVTAADLPEQGPLYRIFPNPVRDMLTIEWLSHADRVVYRLYNSKGILVHASGADLHQTLKKIPMASYSAGIYFLLMQGPQLDRPVKLKITKMPDL